MHTQYMTPQQLVGRYNGTVSERTLANWRSRGEGPPFTKIGGRVLYSMAAVAEWEGARTMPRSGVVRRASATAAIILFVLMIDPLFKGKEPSHGRPIIGYQITA